MDTPPENGSTPKNESPSRRQFLGAAAGVGAAAVWSSLGRAQAAYQEDIKAVAGVDVASLRGAYQLSPNILYLNHGSIGTIPRAVSRARIAYLNLCETNPWLYMWGGAWAPLVDSVRQRVAAYIGASPDTVALTHNTTEGFNLLASGLDLDPGDEVLFSSLNHPGASVCWHHFAEARGYRVKTFSFPIGDVPTMSDDDIVNVYLHHVTEKTRVLVFPHIDNQVGLRHPVKTLTQKAHDSGVEFVAVDGAQAVGMIPVDCRECGVDFYASSPHKWVQSAKGTGIAYLSKKLQASLRAMWVTWGKRRFEGTVRVFEDYGTRNAPEVLSLGDAIDYQVALGNDAKVARYRELWQRFRDEVEGHPKLSWRSPESFARGGSLFAIEAEGHSSEDLFKRLYEERGIVFRAFRTDDLNTMRISPNVACTEDDITAFFQELRRLV